MKKENVSSGKISRDWLNLQKYNTIKSGVTTRMLMSTSDKMACNQDVETTH